MGVPVLIMGKSGSGKSTSLRNFGEKEIALINVSRKPLPFKKTFAYVANTDSYEAVDKILDASKLDTIVIDDAGYLLVNMFMRGHSTSGTGNAIFGFYNQVGDNFWKLVEHIKGMPPQKIVYTIMHEDADETGDVRPKTIGKILDEKVCLEGMFTIVLRAVKENGIYVFKTQSNGKDVSKSPMGMFEPEIDNDLKFVDTTIREYWSLTAPETKPAKEIKV